MIDINGEYPQLFQEWMAIKIAFNLRSCATLVLPTPSLVFVDHGWPKTQNLP